MNDELREIKGLDPEWVKRERFREMRFWGSLVLAILAIAGATWAVVVNQEQDKEIVQVSACQTHPAGSECQKAKLESARAANLHVTCVPFEKAGYRCPKPGSRVAEHSKGVTPQTPSPAHQPPGPPGGHVGSGEGEAPGHPGVSTPPSTQPPPPTPESPAAPTSQIPESGTAPTVIDEPPAPLAPVRETVESAVGGVGTTVCSVNKLGIQVCP